MDKLLTILLFYLISNSVFGQDKAIDWYYEHTNSEVLLQTSFPKGGPYPGPTTEHYNHSYLVFFSRMENISQKPVRFQLEFSAQEIAIPNAPEARMKVFLPSETMTPEKVSQFSYGITTLDLLQQTTQFQKTLQPGEDCYFYLVAFFYQTHPNPLNEYRGGNRAAILLDGQDLVFTMEPQVASSVCGQWAFKE